MKRKSSRDLLTIFLCNLFLTLTVTFFSPMEVVLANVEEFFFPFGNVWWFQLLIALGECAVLTMIMWILPPKAGLIAGGISLALGLAAYIQAMFLNGSMVSLTGARMRLTQEQITWNLAIWGAILLITLGAVVWGTLKNKKTVRNAMRFIAGALVVMQTAAFAVTAFTTDLSARKLDHTLSTAGEFMLADGDNVVEFVLDTADGTFVRAMLEEYPELYESLSGWIYYPNATSVYSRTFPSITYMLSGGMCYFDIPWEDYIENAYRESGFLKGLAEAGTDTRIYTWDPSLVGNSAEAYVANSGTYHYGQFESLNLEKLEENLRKIGLYKSLPYAWKSSFAYSLPLVNYYSFRKEGDDFGEYAFMDPEFYAAFTQYGELSLRKDWQKAYRFYHLFGPHPGADWDANLEYAPVAQEDDEYILSYRRDVLRGSFKMLEAYIGQMKALGIYDRATIIVTADHGISDSEGPEDTLDRQTVSCPVVMIKYAGSDLTKPMQISEAPVSHEDLFAAVEKGLGVTVSGTGSGKSPDEYTEEEARQRYYYHSVFRTDEEGEIALREYLIDGDAEDLANWHLTGKWWDIVYSVNNISPEEFP